MIETIGPLMFFLAPVVFAVIVGVPLSALLWMAKRRDRSRAEQRGFEVKPASGASPEKK